MEKSVSWDVLFFLSLISNLLTIPFESPFWRNGRKQSNALNRTKPEKLRGRESEMTFFCVHLFKLKSSTEWYCGWNECTMRAWMLRKNYNRSSSLPFISVCLFSDAILLAFLFHFCIFRFVWLPSCLFKSQHSLKSTLLGKKTTTIYARCVNASNASNARLKFVWFF